jgi:hypothetical protein
MDDAEFKGYVTAKLEEMHKDIKVLDDHEKRICSLERWRSGLTYALGVISAAVGWILKG